MTLYRIGSHRVTVNPIRLGLVQSNEFKYECGEQVKHYGKIQRCSPFGTPSSSRGNTSSLPSSILSSGDQIRVRWVQIYFVSPFSDRIRASFLWNSYELLRPGNGTRRLLVGSIAMDEQFPDAAVRLRLLLLSFTSNSKLVRRFHRGVISCIINHQIWHEAFKRIAFFFLVSSR